jgi:hypothetical protein
VILLTKVEKAYIAGIIDGEGSIMLTRFHNNQLPSPCVSIASTSLELLTYIKGVANIGTIKGKKNYNKDKHKNSFSYVIKYDNAINLLIDIYPYLILDDKKKRAHMIISEYKNLTPRNGRYSEELLEKKLDFYNRFMNIK